MKWQQKCIPFQNYHWLVFLAKFQLSVYALFICLSIYKKPLKEYVSLTPKVHVPALCLFGFFFSSCLHRTDIILQHKIHRNIQALDFVLYFIFYLPYFPGCSLTFPFWALCCDTLCTTTATSLVLGWLPLLQVQETPDELLHHGCG